MHNIVHLFVVITLLFFTCLIKNCLSSFTVNHMTLEIYSRSSCIQGLYKNIVRLTYFKYTHFQKNYIHAHIHTHIYASIYTHALLHIQKKQVSKFQEIQCNQLHQLVSKEFLPDRMVPLQHVLPQTSARPGFKSELTGLAPLESEALQHTQSSSLFIVCLTCGDQHVSP